MLHISEFLKDFVRLTSFSLRTLRISTPLGRASPAFPKYVSIRRIVQNFCHFYLLLSVYARIFLQVENIQIKIVITLSEPLGVLREILRGFSLL
jgi:hypothetical protein